MDRGHPRHAPHACTKAERQKRRRPERGGDLARLTRGASDVAPTYARPIARERDRSSASREELGSDIRRPTRIGSRKRPHGAARARAPRDRHDDRRPSRLSFGTLPSPGASPSRGSRRIDDVRDVLARCERSRRPTPEREHERRVASRVVPARGSRFVTTTPDAGTSSGAGRDTFYGTCPTTRSALHRASGRRRGLAEGEGRLKPDGLPVRLASIPAGIEASELTRE
jgi:hypothetical protein